MTNINNDVAREVYGDSTIAMSAHNLLIVTGGPLQPASIIEQLRRLQHPTLRPAQLDRALGRLVELGLVSVTDLGYAATDRMRRLIVARCLDDVVENDDGTVNGGWTGWMRREPNGGVSPVFTTKVI